MLLAALQALLFFGFFPVVLIPITCSNPVAMRQDFLPSRGFLEGNASGRVKAPVARGV